jgi:small-conductance mechanosensitive channel/CRP-like cAMP-binding protein
MTQVFRDPDAGWAALLVVVLPLLIIGIGEIEERLRQRDSSLRRSVSILRTWVVPLSAVWALSAVLFAPGADNFVIRVVKSALVIAASAAALAALGVLAAMLRDRPRSDDRRAVPRLVLAMPRLLVLLTTAWLLIAGVWSVDLSSAMTALGVTSLVVSFALQDTLGGIASGFTLLADQPFQPGDWISAGDVQGKVVDVNWRSSRIATRDGDLVVVPNGQLASATITNFDEPTRLHRVVVPLQVAYSNAPTAAKEMLLSAARATPGVLEDPAPAVRVVQIDDPLMGYEVHMWVDDYGIVPAVKSDFGSLVWYHSYRHNVPLPSPAQDLYLWDGDKVALQSRPDHASILQGLRQSQLLAELPDDDLDRLAIAASPHRFAAGETIIESGEQRGLTVLVSGRAQLVLRRPEHVDVVVLALEVGDLLGDLDAAGGDQHGLAVIAATDCEVTTVTSQAAGAVVAQSTVLTTALDQIGTSRRRRVQRVIRRIAQERQLLELEAAAAQMTDPVDEALEEERP